MIKDIDTRRRVILVHPHEHYLNVCDDPNSPVIKYGMQITIPEESMFNRIKFEWIKFIKTRECPDDRVASFEWRDENGVPDFEKLERLIERRKTIEEKRIEIEEELKIKEDCEKFGIEYFGPLREMI